MNLDRIFNAAPTATINSLLETAAELGAGMLSVKLRGKPEPGAEEGKVAAAVVVIVGDDRGDAYSRLIEVANTASDEALETAIAEIEKSDVEEEIAKAPGSYLTPEALEDYEEIKASVYEGTDADLRPTTRLAIEIKTLALCMEQVAEKIAAGTAGEKEVDALRALAWGAIGWPEDRKAKIAARQESAGA